MSSLHTVELRTSIIPGGRKYTAIKIDGVEIRNVKDLQVNPAVRADGEPVPVITVSFYAELV